MKSTWTKSVHIDFDIGKYLAVLISHPGIHTAHMRRPVDGLRWVRSRIPRSLQSDIGCSKLIPLDVDVTTTQGGSDPLFTCGRLEFRILGVVYTRLCILS